MPGTPGGRRPDAHYRYVVLSRPCDVDQKRRHTSIHLLVLEAFVGARPPGMEGCHNDGNPANNRLDNLRWGTLSSNRIDMLKHGTAGSAKLVEADIPAIWARLVAGESVPSIARTYGVGGGTIFSIKHGKTWRHVARDLPGWPLVPIADHSAATPVYPPPEFCDDSVEVWRTIPGWPAYRVSTFGRVETCWERKWGGEGKQHTMGDVWKEKKPSPDRDGYLQIHVSDGRGKALGMFVHRAVLEAFAGPCPRGMVACHTDDVPGNNRASNLRWDTHRSNSEDSRGRRRLSGATFE
jgi:hypothetical protein